MQFSMPYRHNEVYDAFGDLVYSYQLIGLESVTKGAYCSRSCLVFRRIREVFDIKVYYDHSADFTSPCVSVDGMPDKVFLKHLSDHMYFVLWWLIFVGPKTKIPYCDTCIQPQTQISIVATPSYMWCYYSTLHNTLKDWF